MDYMLVEVCNKLRWNTSLIIKARENQILISYLNYSSPNSTNATGIAACNAGFRTRFWRTATLVNALTETKREGNLTKFMK
ncbi:hypothetical protein FACS1894105_03910 [Clostridia bacterium]|nr:hypothetical protein FACS1894105_03910 [Clostridia bacterium]